MKSESEISSARELITGLAAEGRYHFTSEEARSALGVSPAAAKLAVNRLARQGLVASPARGFYVILPPEYRRLGCLPAEQFIPALMERLNLHYYAGLLSAAQYYGAAHQRPQEFQVILARNRRPIQCGAVRVSFIARKRLTEVPVRGFNTPRGIISVSTVEATAVDLVGYEHHTGGLNQVATVLSELAEQVDPQRLVAAAETAPVPWAQRLGYLMERVGAANSVVPLKAYVRSKARNTTYLLPAGPRRNVNRSPDWKLYVNADVESET
ncbi:MAG: type IV toxin-antitoxin system AbiEi family antitoxin [Gammaproteobacteria bacterium]